MVQFRFFESPSSFIFSSSFSTTSVKSSWSFQCCYVNEENTMETDEDKSKEKQSSCMEHACFKLCALPLSRMWRHWFIYFEKIQRSFECMRAWKMGKLPSIVCVWNSRKCTRHFPVIFSSSDAVVQFSRSPGRTRKLYSLSALSDRIERLKALSALQALSLAVLVP